jgi:hypothetical protein
LAEKVEEFHGRPVGDLVLRGRTEALRAFQPVSAEQYKNEAMTTYLEALPSSRRTILPPCRHLQRMSARTPAISSPASTSSGF